MDSRFVHANLEGKIYEFWEKEGYFKGEADSKKKPFSIILPPPNANAKLHLGHAAYVYEDIMIRYKKLAGYATLWFAGADHAGVETQFVFEKNLKKAGKSRFDFERQTLYQMIWDFVAENRGNMERQLRRLGFALDWSREKFTLDPDIIKIVYRTFKKLYDDNLVYRDKRLVNYCVRCGTSFSDLEVNYVERVTPLYFLKYGPFVLATTRPETKFGDTAIAVNPKDKRYTKWIGQEIEAVGLISKFKLKVVADDFVDPKFGTGVVKITPAHDFNDFEVGKRHGLEVKQVINFDGKLNAHTGKYEGLFVTKARIAVVEDMKKAGLIEKIQEDYINWVGVCYKCGTTIEPLPLEQWFIKVEPLAKKAIEAISKKQIIFHPQKYKKIALDWLTNFHDWNISRQIVWGIGIPAWKCEKCDEWIITEGDEPINCIKCKNSNLKRDPDTFDTWFSSSQWPYATLQTIGEDFFEYFYQTSVMETAYDILPWWVCRMMMMGIFATGEVPFRAVYLHGLVRDSKGQKMSKSKGNTVDPMMMVEKYGADALRGSMVFGVGDGHDLSFTEDRVIGMRNFANKIWNVGRFIYMNRQSPDIPASHSGKPKAHLEDPESFKRRAESDSGQARMTINKLKKEFIAVKKNVIKNMENYKFSAALGELYEFLWHRFADFYIEELKEDVQSGKLETLEGLTKVYLDTLILLHPFMPFVTEALWKQFKGQMSSILNERL